MNKYQDNILSLLKDNESLRKVNTKQQKEIAGQEITSQHLQKQLIDHFIKEVKLSTGAGSEATVDKIKEVLAKQFLEMRVLIKRAMDSERHHLIQEKRALVYKQKEELKSEKQNYIRLLKHIKNAVYEKAKNKEVMSGVLEAIQLKINELHEVKIAQREQENEQQASEICNAEIKQSYTMSTLHYQK